MQETERITGEGRVKEADLVALGSSTGQKNGDWFMDGIRQASAIPEWQELQ